MPRRAGAQFHGNIVWVYPSVVNGDRELAREPGGQDGLKRAADRAVDDALSFGRAVELEPMGPQERRIVHVYLRDRTDVQTHSEGDEPDRRLVVTPVKAGGG